MPQGKFKTQRKCTKLADFTPPAVDSPLPSSTTNLALNIRGFPKLRDLHTEGKCSPFGWWLSRGVWKDWARDGREEITPWGLSSPPGGFFQICHSTSKYWLVLVRQAESLSGQEMTTWAPTAPLKGQQIKGNWNHYQQSYTHTSRNLANFSPLKP